MRDPRVTVEEDEVAAVAAAAVVAVVEVAVVEVAAEEVVVAAEVVAVDLRQAATSPSLPRPAPVP